MVFRLIRIIKKFDLKLKKKAAILFLISLSIIPLEFFSIAAIIPVFSSIFDTNPVNSNLNLEFLEFTFIGENRIVNTLIFLLLLFSLKNFFLTLFFKFKFNYIFLIQKHICQMIFFKYLSSNYNFYIKNNSSTIIRNIISEVNIFTKNYLQSIIELILEIIVLVTIGIFLIIYDPKTTILLLIFLIMITLSIDKLRKNKIKSLGFKRQIYHKLILELLISTFRGIKEIKANFLEKKILNIFNDRNFMRLFTEQKMSYYSSLPKLLFELICLFGLSLIIFLNMSRDINLGEMIAVYTFATFRIMPSFVKLTMIFQNIKFAEPSLEVIRKHYLKEKDEINSNIKKNEEILSKIKKNQFQTFRNFKIVIDEFRYDTNIIIKNFDLSLYLGEKICISGKSGSGKTTLVDIITGVIQTDSLKFFLDGKKLDENIFFQKSAFSYIPQNPTIFQTSIKENITLFEKDGEIKEDNYSRAIKLSNSDFIKNYDEGDNKILAENGINLSGGQIQRIFIARAIYSNKNILIFDESTNELDSKTENQIVDDILNLPQSVIFITHKEEIKDKFSRVISIENK